MSTPEEIAFYTQRIIADHKTFSSTDNIFESVSEIAPNLFLGDYRFDRTIPFDLVISIFEFKTPACNSRAHIHYKCNGEDPEMEMWARQSAKLIDFYLKNNKRVFVHCFHGVGRGVS